MNKEVTLQAKRIIFLDYLRIFAFLSVLVGHKFISYVYAFIHDPDTHAVFKQLGSFSIHLLLGGGAGVVAFFLVSGYVIASVLEREHTLEFVIKRVFRIYPLYVLAILSEAFFSGPMPPSSVLIPRLLLLGDFLPTAYALAGVEWTLRIEILFYAYMAILKALGLFESHRHRLASVFILTTILLSVFKPFPSAPGLFIGYTSLYLPILLLGAMIYLRETGEVKAWLLWLFGAFIVFRHYYLIEEIHPNWLSYHFVPLSLLLFFFAWYIRASLPSPWIVLFLSNLTYSVYLFHNWTWPLLQQHVVLRYTLPSLSADLQTLALLMALCWVATKFVEKPGIALGRIVCRKLARGR